MKSYVSVSGHGKTVNAHFAVWKTDDGTIHISCSEPYFRESISNDAASSNGHPRLYRRLDELIRRNLKAGTAKRGKL